MSCCLGDQMLDCELIFWLQVYNWGFGAQLMCLIDVISMFAFLIESLIYNRCLNMWNGEFIATYMLFVWFHVMGVIGDDVGSLEMSFRQKIKYFSV